MTQVATVRQTLGDGGRDPGRRERGLERRRRRRSARGACPPRDRAGGAAGRHLRADGGSAAAGAGDDRRRREPGLALRRTPRARARTPATWPPSRSPRSAGSGAALEIAETIPSYLSSSLEGPVGHHRRGSRRAGPAVRAAATRASRTASPPSGSSPRRWAAVRLPSATSFISTSGPGLGVEIDEDALAARRLD